MKIILTLFLLLSPMQITVSASEKEAESLIIDYFINIQEISRSKFDELSTIEVLELLLDENKKYTDMLNEIDSTYLEKHPDAINSVTLQAIHDKLVPLYYAYFQAVSSSEGYQSYFDNMVYSGQDPFKLLKTNQEIQSIIDLTQ